jgi:hypothetical protein
MYWATFHKTKQNEKKRKEKEQRKKKELFFMYSQVATTII